MADDATPTDKVKAPLDTATVLAFAICFLVLLALVLSALKGDTALSSDISKNFIGPGFLIVLGYYFGATSAGRRKDETIATMVSDNSDKGKKG